MHFLMKMCFLLQISLISSLLMFLSQLLFLIQNGFQTLLHLLHHLIILWLHLALLVVFLILHLIIFVLDLLHSSTPISCVPDPPIQLSPFDSTSLLSPSIPNVNSSLSSSSPSLDISILVNIHPMLTKSKLGIHKPKVLQVTTDYTY